MGEEGGRGRAQRGLQFGIGDVEGGKGGDTLQVRVVGRRERVTDGRQGLWCCDDEHPTR